MNEVRTEDLFLAAFLRSVGATIVRYEDGARGQGAVVLDLTDVTATRVTAEADKFAQQVRKLPAIIRLADVSCVLDNTLLGPLADQLVKMRKTILNRRPS